MVQSFLFKVCLGVLFCGNAFGVVKGLEESSEVALTMGRCFHVVSSLHAAKQNTIPLYMGLIDALDRDQASMEKAYYSYLGDLNELDYQLDKYPSPALEPKYGEAGARVYPGMTEANFDALTRQLVRIRRDTFDYKKKLLELLLLVEGQIPLLEKHFSESLHPGVVDPGMGQAEGALTTMFMDDALPEIDSIYLSLEEKRKVVDSQESSIRRFLPNDSKLRSLIPEAALWGVPSVALAKATLNFEVKRLSVEERTRMFRENGQSLNPEDLREHVVVLLLEQNLQLRDQWVEIEQRSLRSDAASKEALSKCTLSNCSSIQKTFQAMKKWRRVNAFYAKNACLARAQQYLAILNVLLIEEIREESSKEFQTLSEFKKAMIRNTYSRKATEFVKAAGHLTRVAIDPFAAPEFLSETASLPVESF